LVIRVFSGRGWNPSGLPFSPLAFVLAVELLAIKIRHCENIKGLNYWKARNGFLESIIKFALYADDLTLFLKDEQDMQQALGILAVFYLLSAFSSKQICTDTFFGFVWKRRLKILGVYFACDKSASRVEENWMGRVENIKNGTKETSALLAKSALQKRF